MRVPYLVCAVLVACGGASDEGPQGSEARSESTSEATSISDERSCVSEFEGSDNNDLRRVTALAMEIFADATPSRVVQLFVQLVEVDYDFGDLDIAEREAQLAPYQDEVVAKVEQAGGEVVSRSWLTNSVVVKLASASIPEVFCWPHVVRVEVSTPYWDAVDPFWDPSSVGFDECPIVEGECPVHCFPVDGQRFNADRACLLASELIACDRRGYPTTDDEKCRFNEATGVFYRAGGVGPLEPSFANWRDCTSAEYERIVLAGTCG